MAYLYHQQYYLEDFDEYANEHIPDQYNALKTCPTWTMEYKTIRDGDNVLKRVPMLLVGRPFFLHGRQDAWAWATGTSIKYFHAERGDEFVSTIRDLQTNKVYYLPPLTWAVGAQDTSHGMTKSRRTAKALAELLINFIFLLEDKILSIPSSGNTSLMSDFEYACRMFAMRREEARNPRNEYHAYYNDPYGQAGPRGLGFSRSGESDRYSTFSTVKDEPRDDDAPSSRLPGTPYRATNTFTPKKVPDLASSIKSRRHDRHMGIKQEPRDDERATPVSWSGSSYTSTSSRTSGTPYLGMFTPHASTIRSSSGSSDNPIRLEPDHITVKRRIGTHNRSSSSFTTSTSSPPRRSSDFFSSPARSNEQTPDTPIKIKTEPDQDRCADQRRAQEQRRRHKDVPVQSIERAQGMSAAEQARADRMRAIERRLKRCREDQEPGIREERAAQRLRVMEEFEEADYEEIW